MISGLVLSFLVLGVKSEIGAEKQPRAAKTLAAAMESGKCGNA